MAISIVIWDLQICPLAPFLRRSVSWLSHKAVGGNLQGCAEVMNIDTVIPVVAFVMIHPRPKPRAYNPSDVSV